MWFLWQPWSEPKIAHFKALKFIFKWIKHGKRQLTSTESLGSCFSHSMGDHDQILQQKHSKIDATNYHPNNDSKKPRRCILWHITRNITTPGSLVPTQTRLPIFTLLFIWQLLRLNGIKVCDLQVIYTPQVQNNAAQVKLAWIWRIVYFIRTLYIFWKILLIIALCDAVRDTQQHWLT